MNSTALDKRVDLFIVIMRYPMSVIDHKDGPLPIFGRLEIGFAHNNGAIGF